MTTVTAEIDHLFVMTSADAPAADRLVDSGITEGAPRSHPGQGTTNRRFFFENVMLEFLWVHDSDEAGNTLVQPTYLLERWHRRDAGGSPFGICLRPASQSNETPPFATWEYDPPYLPAGLDIKVATNAANIEEPFLFFLPWARPRDDSPTHDAGLRTLTEVTIRAPVTVLFHDTLRTMDRVVRFEESDGHHMTLVFDDERQGEMLELSPISPLTIRY